MKLEKLMQEQIELMSVVRDEWIDIALHKGPKIDKEEVEAGVKWLYYSSNLKEPEIVFVDGPADFAKKFLPASVKASVRDSVRDSVGASVWDSVRDSVGASVWDSVRDSVRDSVWDSVRASVGASVGASVRDSVRASVWASVRASVWASVGDSVWDSVRASVRDSVRASVRDSVRASVSWQSLAYDADWSAWYEYYKKIGVIDNDKANKYIGYLKGGAFYTMFFEKKAFVMCRPVKVEQDEQKRLHSTKGPALSFLDGTELYMLHGVKFEKEWWSKIVNDELDPKTIFAIDNLEHRRIAYEFMDKTKMKSLKDYKVLDEVKDDGYGYAMKIVSFSVKEVEQPLKYLNCFCPSTGREYFIGTNFDTCKEAKAQSFGFKADEIEFLKEW